MHYETTDGRMPQLDSTARPPLHERFAGSGRFTGGAALQAAVIDAEIAARHPHLRDAIESSQPAGAELRTLRRQALTGGASRPRFRPRTPAAAEDRGLAYRRRQLDLLRLAAN